MDHQSDYVISPLKSSFRFNASLLNVLALELNSEGESQIET
jgi:hypothetical protein